MVGSNMGEPHQIRLVHGTDEMKNKTYKTVAGYAVGDGFRSLSF